MSDLSVQSLGSEIVTGMGFVLPAEMDRLRAGVGGDLGTRYEVLDYLGHGAFATVWRVRDRSGDQLIAVKRFEARVQARGFYREMRLLFRLKHERIVQVVNLLESAGARYLILELCAGGSLRPALSRARRAGQGCPPERARELALHLVEGLAAAHRQGIVHRDIKPENILFTRAEQGLYGGGSDVKLADFGLARVLTASTAFPDGLRNLSGSPAYMAPEQFEGRFLPASDLYALGVVFFELLHGRLPFEGTPENLAQQHLRQTPALSDDLDDEWRGWLTALLDKEPGKRLTAEEWRKQLAAREVPVAARSPRLAVGRVVLSHAAFGLVATEHPTTSAPVAAVSAKGLEWVVPGSESARAELPIPGLTQVVQGADGLPWLVQGRNVLRFGSPDWVELALTRPHDVSAVVPPVEACPRLAVVGEGRLSEFEVGSSEPLWSEPVREGGIRLPLTRLLDGRVALAERAFKTRLRVLSLDGRTDWCLPLPGICWNLLLWPAAGELVCQLLIGNAFKGFRVDPDRRTLEPLTGDEDVMFLSVSHSDQALYALAGSGAVTRWTPGGGAERVWTFGPRPSGFRGFAAAGPAFAVLSRDHEGLTIDFGRRETPQSVEANPDAGQD